MKQKHHTYVTWDLCVLPVGWCCITGYHLFIPWVAWTSFSTTLLMSPPPARKWLASLSFIALGFLPTKGGLCLDLRMNDNSADSSRLKTWGWETFWWQISVLMPIGSLGSCVTPLFATSLTSLGDRFGSSPYLAASAFWRPSVHL